MKKAAALMTALALVALVASPVFAGDKGEKVQLTGWITDSYCGKANANAEGKECALACAEKGAELVLFSKDKIYKLSDQDGAKQHVGYEVIVTGSLNEDGTVNVTGFKKKEEKKA